MTALDAYPDHHPYLEQILPVAEDDFRRSALLDLGEELGGFRFS
jgi:hypothetical protein